jgi:gliding motility-associated-like protein
MRKILRKCVFNKHILFTLCLGFSFLCDTNAQVSGTFTINRLVATGGSNFNSFAAAVAHLSGGVNGAVTFNVVAGSGPYNEQVIINNIAGTSAANTITFNCNGETLTFLSTDPGQRAGVKLNNADYVIFDNLVVVPQAAAGGEYGYGFHLLNDADHNTIRNCFVNNQINWDDPLANEGIVINGSDGYATEPGNSNCDDNLISQNTITGSYDGITLSSQPVSGSPVFMNGNRIVNNRISNSIWVGIQTLYTTNTLIDGNEITGGPDAIYGSYGIYVSMLNQSLSVTRNKIHGFDASAGNLLYGIFISSESEAGKECLIANNLIYDLKCGNTIYGIASTTAPFSTISASYLNIYHNTISIDDQDVPGEESYGIYLREVTNVNVSNNIVTVTRPTSTQNYGIYFFRLPTNFTGRNNVYYVPLGMSPRCATGYYDGNFYETINEWRINTGFDLYSTNANPAYVNLAGFDLRPNAQIIDNMAMPALGITGDITAAVRGAAPDPGCYEFNSPACSTPVNAGSIRVLPDSILCSGPQVYFNLSGNSAGSGQTYTWQTSTTAGGTYTNVGAASGYSSYEVTPTNTRYYRVAVACGAVTAFTSPVRVLVNTTLNTGTYTINNALPTGGTNFNSFRDAALALLCGINGPVVFNVAGGSGPYNEQLIIPAVNTTPVNTVTFNCNGATIAYEPNDPDLTAVVKLDGADYITFDSLHVNVLGTVNDYGIGIQIARDADHNTIKRCKIDINTTSLNTFYAGIVINPGMSNPDDPAGWSYCDSNTIVNNTITGGYWGISCSSKSNVSGQEFSIGNVFKNNILKDNAGYGIYVSGTANSIIDNNDISQPTRTTLTGYTGVMVFRANAAITVSKNRVHNLSEGVKSSNVQLEGIHFELVNTPAATPNVVSNNMVYNFRGNGWQYGLYDRSSSHLKFYHNTISLEDTASKSIGNTRGFGLFGTVVSPGLELWNNSIVIRRGGTGQKHCVYMNYIDPGMTMNYNNLYITSNAGANFLGHVAGVNYNTFANWQTTGRDANSISIDPVYHDIANGDLTPTKIPFEDKGTNVGILADINDLARSTTTPDIGAIEFSICRALSNPMLSVEEASVNTIRFGWTAVPGTTGYRVSIDEGATWTIPSSGAMGTTHLVTSLKPTDSVVLIVKALGTRIDCPENLSLAVQGKAQTNLVFIPNTFSPNNNGIDDYFKVYSTVMKTMRLMVFNQWGVKVFETNDPQGAWDGTYKGNPQPVGVYVYVVTGALLNGAKVNEKGTFNLIR